MTRQGLGSVIGAVFGLLFILLNTGPLPTAATLVLRVLAILAFVAVVVAVRRAPSTPSEPAGGLGFGRGYRVIVAAEVVATGVGLGLVDGPLHTPRAALPWVVLVVGLHFLGLAILWGQSQFHWLGGALLACGAVGLALAAGDSTRSAIAIVAGVLPGALLLAAGLWSSRQAAASVPAGQG